MADRYQGRPFPAHDDYGRGTDQHGQKSDSDPLAELARRYFNSHGPATVHDFAWWSGLAVSDARSAVALAEPHLANETVAGRAYWYSQDTPPPAKRTPDVHLLPAFDEFLVGYTDRSAVLRTQDAPSVNNGGGILSPTIVVDGQVVGTWKRTFKKDAVIIESNLFRELNDDEQAAFMLAAKRYAEFLGMKLIK